MLAIPTAGQLSFWPESWLAKGLTYWLVGFPSGWLSFRQGGWQVTKIGSLLACWPTIYIVTHFACRISRLASSKLASHHASQRAGKTPC